ncbi:phage tail tape measure protein [Fusobacterium perfoetens]|uniref:phage tail tape measure protein n=1 Tax=Fusobacterium perfoetens TaxID=852 RepID=UPI001F3DB789|nr:phage tail tape measure protein [Fusobacterium perfoetens]MCF2611749.1 phage tail tape measure protein [Fusobacterium perfoetens]
MAEREYIEIITSVKGQEEVSKLKTEVDKLGKESQETGEQVEKFDDSITNATNKSKTLTQRLKELAHQFRATGQESNKSSTTILGAVKKYVAVGTAIAGLKKATNIFTAFDDEMRKVQATAGATTKEFEALRNQAKDLGSTTSWSASEAAQAQFEFAKAGFTANEILKATPSILNTAIAGQLDLAEATSITAGALRMFKLDALESERVGDALAMTANTTTTDIRGLGESLKYAGLGATDFGLSLEQTLALLGTLGNNKIDSSMAGTGLRSVFSALKDKNKIKLLNSVDIQLTEDGKYRNFLKILDDIKLKTKGMAEAQKQAFMKDVFGEQGELVISALLKTDSDKINDLIYKLDHAKGYSQKLAETFEKGLGGSFRGLNSAIEGLAISFIDNFAPAISVTVNSISSAVNSLSLFFDWLNNGSLGARILSGAVIGLTAIYTAHIIKLKAVATWTAINNWYKQEGIIQTIISTGVHYGLATAQGVVTISTKVLSGAIAMLNGALGLLTAPVLLVIAVGVGLGAIFYDLYKRSEKFRNGVNSLIEKIKELWGWIKKFTGVGVLIDVGKGVVNGVKDLLGFGQKNKTVIQGSEEENKKKITNTVETETKNIDNSKGKGVNTDYLLLGDNTQGNSSNKKYIHNGYYLKGTKNLSSTSVNSAITNNKNIVDASKFEDKKRNEENDFSTSNNVYNSYSTSQNKVIEKSPEEKIVELLTNIKDLLSSKKSSDSKVQINVTKESSEDILSQVVEDLTIALGNI